MPFAYKIDVLTALKEKGYSTYRIRKDKLFAEATLQMFRRGEIASQTTLEKLCDILDCQPGDLLIYKKDPPQD